MPPSTPQQQLYLFGSSIPFTPPPWQTKDDRIRGGASRSHLTPLPNNSARFHGQLDTSTLGGAGFASQFSAVEAAPMNGSSVAGTVNDNGDGGRDGGEGEEEMGEARRYWDLSGYEGVELVVVGGGGAKVWTFVLRDEVGKGKRGDGRERAGVNWEYEFEVPRGVAEEEEEAGGRVWIPWTEFKATYRGREIDDAGELKRGRVRRVGIMMRSYFGKQEGDFSLEIQSISVRKGEPALSSL